MKTIPFILRAACCAVVLAGIAASAQTNFFDGTFNEADWNSVRVDQSDGTLAVSQVASGGNPGFFRQIDHIDFTSLFVDFHFRSGANYHPANLPNALLDFSIEEIAIQNLNNIGIAVHMALQQNGTNYWGPRVELGPTFVNSLSVWAKYSLRNLREQDFGEFILDPSVDYTGLAHPDFSAHGSAITLGFATANNNVTTFGSRSAGFDNWSVRVHGPPTLSSPIVLPDGQIGMQLQTIAGHSVSLLTSPDLVNWRTLIVTNDVVADLVSFVDASLVTDSPARFYRVIEVVP